MERREPARMIGAWALIVTAAMSLGGCLGGGSAPSALLTLTASQAVPAGTSRTAVPGEALAVLTPSVPRAVNTRRIPVYVNAITIQYLVGASWVEEPQELFRRLVAETVAARTGRLVLDPLNFTEDAGATLSGQLIQFGFDPNRMEAVVVYEAALARSGQPLRIQRFEGRVPVAVQDAATIAPALNQASNQVAGEVAAWIGG